MIMWRATENSMSRIQKLRSLIPYSQPAHWVSVATMFTLSCLLFPGDESVPKDKSTLASLLYIFTFATHFGSQIWMTFIAGIVLYFTMPRAIFGQVQKQLFPKYFFLNSILGFITLFLFTTYQPQNHDWQFHIQSWTLTTCFVSQLALRLYVVPNMLRTMEARGSVEKAAGVGMEIGKHEPGKLRDDNYYMNLHKRFRRMHGICALANVVAISCNAYHMYYIATKLGRAT